MFRLSELILIFMNILSFSLFYIDKKKAINKKQRISEFTLLLSAFLFGSVGAILSMNIFHHKTKKLKFKILVPIFFILQVVIILISKGIINVNFVDTFR